MKTIYIPGKIEGCNKYDTYGKFLQAEQDVGERFREPTGDAFSYPRVINPMGMRDIPNGSWFDYMMRDLVYLKHCDAIYMLKDWKDSAGARIEHEFAKKLGLEIIYEEE